MALVHTRGGTKRQRQRAQTIALWAAYELMHPRMADNIEINIDLCIPDGAEGFCTWADDNIKPREFDIEINKTLEGDDFDTCLLHEMVHVKQYAKNELRERYQGGHHQMWKGRKYVNSNYLKQPWEKEAYKMQEILLQRLKNE